MKPRSHRYPGPGGGDQSSGQGGPGRAPNAQTAKGLKSRRNVPDRACAGDHATYTHNRPQHNVNNRSNLFIHHKCVREPARTPRDTPRPRHTTSATHTTFAPHHTDYAYRLEASHSIPTHGACNTVVRAGKGLQYPTNRSTLIYRR